MIHQRQLNKIGATPGKLALMGVLAVVLVVVIVMQLPKGADNQQTEENLGAALLPGASPQRPAEQTSSAQLSGSDDNRPTLPAWPEISLTEALASDPFALPDWAAEQVREATVTSQEPDRLAELQKQGASIVVIAAGRKSASIGEQKVQVGDILAGYKVSDITTQGILVDKLAAP